MAIIAVYTPSNEQVEVLDVYPAGGVVLATVRALAGCPFVGGDKWPVRTAYAVVRACELRSLAFDLAALQEVCYEAL